MSFEAALTQLRSEVRAQSPGVLQQALDRSVEELKIVPSRRKVTGDASPQFQLTDATGKLVTLASHLQKGPVVVNFYRGGWCPFCNFELHALQRALPRFKALGAQLMAISPEAPDNSLSTIEKHKLEFPVLSDLKCEVAHQFGIVYTVPEYLKSTFEKFGLDLKKYNATDKVELPIPATYVIDQQGIIQYAFANEDFSVRADIADILQTLTRLKK
jgi:peroxiredoxin